MGAGFLLLSSSGPAFSQARSETLEEALCRLIEQSARSENVPVEFLTRLIWQESSFRTGVVSPAGAQGVAQFMPGTATERGLQDPFDPEQAIPEAAKLIAELTTRFGSSGLAAAAYNGGPARVTGWLAAKRELAPETQRYVYSITGRSAEEWAAAWREDRVQAVEAETATKLSCMQVTALLRMPGRDGPGEAPLAPWGVQLAGNFSKERALRSFSRTRMSYASARIDAQPMVIGTRLRNRGTRIYYRVRVPAATRETATRLCDQIRSLGGSCIVLRS